MHGKVQKYLNKKHIKMKTNGTLDILKRLKPELIERFGVVRLALFSSTVRNEATAKI